MPRAKKSDKFYLYAPEQRGRYKGTQLLGARGEDATFQDLLDFLQVHGIEPSKIALGGHFTTRTLRYPPILSGTRVRTTKANLALRKEWTKEAWESRQWGVRGKVRTHHDSHGLSYEVEHPDGSIGHYDPSEIEVR